MTKYTAIIIEPRKHLALPFVLKNFNEHLEKEWSFIIFHGTKNKEYVENIIDTVFIENKSRFRLVNLHVENLYSIEYSNLIKKKSMVYDHIQTETFLIFQVDTLILKENKHLINDFLEYDYVGAPWQDGVVGNGGLSLRKKSKMMEIVENNRQNYDIYKNEDEFFCRQMHVSMHRPSFEMSRNFSVETVFNEAPWGVHNCYTHLPQKEWDFLTSKYPELKVLHELNTITKTPLKAQYTIVYKTYKNDLQWLEYSLESLKKYLVPVNIFEIIIYTHDVDYSEVVQLLDKLQIKHFVPYRVLPVAYNFHGYIKQMSVKVNCYKDVQTKYVVLLDCDLILQKYLDIEWLIREDGKIEWKYLKIEDDPTNPVFSVRKKACEDSNMIEKKIHYTSNGFPFIFTRKSLEDASNKFIEMHGRDYDSYCYVRCHDEHINVESPTTSIFNILTNIFSEFEYLGFFCHYYSTEYIFTTTPYCRMNYQNGVNDNNDLYFIQHLSYGEKPGEIMKKINKILS